MSPWFPKVPLFGRPSAEGAADGPGIHSWTQIRIFVGTRRGNGVCVRHRGVSQGWPRSHRGLRRECLRSLLYLGIRNVPFRIPRFFQYSQYFYENCGLRLTKTSFEPQLSLS